MKTVHLIPFSPPRANSSGGFAIGATLKKTDHKVSADFSLQGNTTAIRWSAPLTEAKQGDELWKQTCFELFLAAPNRPEYWEYNFSPSRQWAIYAFKDYRQSAPLHITTTPIIEPPRLSDASFSLRVSFNLEPPLLNKTLIIGVSAIIDTTDDQRHYFALRHCGTSPDFHMRESFILEMN